MPKPLLHWIAVAIMLLVSGYAPAQSLFYESLKIKKILDQRNQPTIYTSDFRNNWEVRLDNRLISHSDTLRLTQIGRYTIKRSDTADSLLYVAYGTSIEQIVVPQIIQIDNMPNEVAWTTRSATTRLPVQSGDQVDLSKSDSLPWQIRENMQPITEGQNDDFFQINTPGRFGIRAPRSFELALGDSSWTINLPENYRLVVEFSNNELSFYQVSGFRAGRLSKPDFYELMTFLAMHSEYQESSFGLNSLENVYKKYRDNPFLAPLLDTLLYSYKFEEIAPFLDFDETKFGQQIKQELTEYYPWITSMYGNPSLDNKTQILEEKDVSYYAKLDPTDKSSAQQLQNASQQANAAYTKVSGLDQTSIIVGLSDFIAERAQEELNITFLDRFKRRLTTSEPNEFSVLFPSTYDLFLQFEIANYKKLLQNARPIFATDLQNLGLHLPNLLKLDKYKELLNYSTEVYNLALFYEVTRLTYNERPIEDILVASFQQMQRRSRDMGEIINLSLADTIMRTNHLPPTSPTRLKSGAQQLLKTFNQLRPEVITYNKEIKQAYGDLKRANILLDGNLDALLQQIDDKTTPWLNKRIQDLRSRLGSKDGKIVARFNYQVPEIEEPKKAFDYYEHYAGNNLAGQGFFGYYLDEQSSNFKDYETFFSRELTEKAYVARGLELTRLMLDENFDEILADWCELLAEISPQARTIQEQIILQRRAQLDTLVQQVIDLRAAISTGIISEIETWKSAGLSDTTQMDLAALSYLNKLIDIGTQEVWVTLSTFNDLLADPSTFSLLLDASGLSTEDFLQKRNEADRELQRIFREAMKRVEALQTKYPDFNRPLNPGFQTYHDIRRKAISFDASEFANLTRVDTLVNSSLRQIQKIIEKRTSLGNQLNQLDQKYAPSNLTKARVTSQDLATAVELSVHLLFSLKKEVKEVKPMVQDTSIAQYTIVNRDSTGLVDSSVVISQQLIRPDTVGIARKQTSWLKKESFDSIMQNPQGRAIFLGLLYQQLKALKGGPSFSTDGLATLMTKLINTIYSIESDRNALDQKKLKSEKISFKDYYPFIQTTVDLFSTVVETPIYKDSSLAQRIPSLGSITKVAQEGLSLYNNIDEKQYGYAIYNAMEIFRVISEAESNRRRQLGKETFRGDRIRNIVILYGTFMADVVNARSSDQVKEALRAAASPPGSSRLKRELLFNMAVNAYLGPGAGLERLAFPAAGSNQFSGTIGLSVPIGLSFSWKWDKAARNSFSLFIPVLDIGAVTYFRLNDENANNLPDFGFKNFIAPGAFLYYNIHNSPFTFGGGWQYGPQIRGTSLTDPNQTSPASRFLIFAGIDVPLFNLANGPMAIPNSKKRKKKHKEKDQNSNPPKTKTYQ
ncbi:MAG: hypothetical protein DHS20C18_07150 [Saprospiraceae bacterium]|nr:MAG: hypothetical protein DHS20C18_07150 [Saprospiraceae bacterium]